MRKHYLLFSLLSVSFFFCNTFFVLFGQRIVYNYLGENQTYTVPENVFALRVNLWGAGGAGGDILLNSTAHGGGGGFASGVICVTPGDVLTIIVGQGGEKGSVNQINSTMYGGGGAGGANRTRIYAGAGGGRSAILLGTNELITAGGGGGGGESRNLDRPDARAGSGGAGGGVRGRTGGDYNGINVPNGAGGRGGQQTIGGNGGIGTKPEKNGAMGGRGIGGRGGSVTNKEGRGGGGGGGGYYGGGGGGGKTTDRGAGGGGGGSSYIGGVQMGVVLSGGLGDIPGSDQYIQGNPMSAMNPNRYGKGGLVGQNGNHGVVFIEPYIVDAGSDVTICKDDIIKLQGNVFRPSSSSFSIYDIPVTNIIFPNLDEEDAKIKIEGIPSDVTILSTKVYMTFSSSSNEERFSPLSDIRVRITPPVGVGNTLTDVGVSDNPNAGTETLVEVGMFPNVDPTGVWSFSFRELHDHGFNPEALIEELRIVVDYEERLPNPTHRYTWSGGPIVSGVNTLTPEVNPALTTYYKLTANIDGCIGVDSLLVSVDQPYGAYTIFGDNMWNVYAFNKNNTLMTEEVRNKMLDIDPAIMKYRGSYSDTTLNINTSIKWATDLSPSFAPTFRGCDVQTDHHLFIYKRKGFPCGTYALEDFLHSNVALVKINDRTVYRSTECCTGVISEKFNLDGESKVEIRVGNLIGVSSLIMNFNTEYNRLSGDAETKECFVSKNSGWNYFSANEGKIIAAVDPGRNDLGVVKITSYVEPPFLAPSCQVGGGVETAVLGRHWTIFTQKKASHGVRVRLYIDQEEHDTLVPLSQISSNPDDETYTISDLRLSRYYHPNDLGVNRIFEDNCSYYPIGKTISRTQYGAGYASEYHSGFDRNGRYVVVEIAGTGELWLHGSKGEIALATELTAFTAVCEGGQTKVSWTTNSETNSDYFSIESSHDGFEWRNECTVDGAGTTNETNNYSTFLESRRAAYFRIVQVDKSGEKQVSEPILSVCDEKVENSLSIFPNPNNGHFKISVNSIRKWNEFKVKLLSIEGKVVSREKYKVAEGQNILYFDRDNILPGSYVLMVEGEASRKFKPVRIIVH